MKKREKLVLACFAGIARIRDARREWRIQRLYGRLLNERWRGPLWAMLRKEISQRSPQQIDRMERRMERRMREKDEKGEIIGPSRGCADDDSRNQST